MTQEKRLVLTEGQSQLIAHPLRIRILHALSGKELTAAQVADALGESRGNVHYHIQKLYAGGLLELTRTEPHGGIMERYYLAPTTRFGLSSQGNRASSSPMRIQTWLERTPAEAETLLETLEALLGAWERVGSLETKAAPTWKVTVTFEPILSDEDSTS